MTDTLLERSRNPSLQARRRLAAGSVMLALLVLPGLVAAQDASATAVADADHSLGWLIGDWQAEFRPHGEDMPAPTMRFEWRDENRSILTMYGTRPGPGGELVPEYETTVVWHPVKKRFVFLGAYLSGDSHERQVIEDGEIEILDDGGVRLLMDVHYPSGVTVPFTDGTVAGAEGHTLHFQRTFRRAGPDELRGVFRIRRGDRWEDPHPDSSFETGYPWRRIQAVDQASELVPPPAWVLEHWAALAGTWVADNSAHRNDVELADAYAVEWTLGIGGRSLSGRLYAIEGGEEASTYWEFREFWHPASGQLVTEQFGADGTYGVGSQTKLTDGTLELEQTFHFVSSGAVTRSGHRSTLDGDLHTTTSFDIDDQGDWIQQRRYVWQRQSVD